MASKNFENEFAVLRINFFLRTDVLKPNEPNKGMHIKLCYKVSLYGLQIPILRERLMSKYM